MDYLALASKLISLLDGGGASTQLPAAIASLGQTPQETLDGLLNALRNAPRVPSPRLPPFKLLHLLLTADLSQCPW